MPLILMPTTPKLIEDPQKPTCNTSCPVFPVCSNIPQQLRQRPMLFTVNSPTRGHSTVPPPPSSPFQSQVPDVPATTSSPPPSASGSLSLASCAHAYMQLFLVYP